ncbi:putative 3-demethylubiquinone-9 3-methyltransferase (glyoxalase superfamily) [Stackebrandtia albiflava]|uniref:Putative 3-demethylubiquinone-9 3-methyltransferase (Glyoxalase superfamily) n=1 Tax=Stackebrandtia albiflava TaxID=406432 RepID=A0A562VBC9_9ACTN|nr:VOC family protein [Stackebrandtia albiflava]TWJ15168.1 putative 3-demethylubiquinone-9 3-methyltransferase (glyoxalase superfamily) [Stackebrandtia albiflava]
MQKIVTNLWYDGDAETAAAYYTSLFDDGRITDRELTPESAPGETGSVMTVTFTLAGQQFVAINGGPEFRFTPAMSLQVNCADQAEVDRLWNALTADGGSEQPCGWLTDRWGVSWQIVPTAYYDLVTGADPAVADRVFAALMTMTRIDIAALEAAARG